MRDQVIIQQFTALMQRLAMLEHSMKLGITGEMIRNEAIQAVLIEKGLVTSEDITKAIGDVIKKTQEQAAAQVEKPEIVLPTPEQVAQVQEEAPKQ